MYLKKVATYEKGNENVGQSLVELIEWLKKADSNTKKAKINTTSIKGNNGERIKL